MIDPRDLLEYLEQLHVLPASEQIKVIRVYAEVKRDRLLTEQVTFREIEQGTVKVQ